MFSRLHVLFSSSFLSAIATSTIASILLCSALTFASSWASRTIKLGHFGASGETRDVCVSDLQKRSCFASKTPRSLGAPSQHGQVSALQLQYCTPSTRGYERTYACPKGTRASSQSKAFGCILGHLRPFEGKFLFAHNAWHQLQVSCLTGWS